MNAQSRDSTPRQLPLEVARETFVIRAVTPSVAGTFTNLNSMVIRGAEPVLVDTGMGIYCETWFADVFSLVAPEDVRWIFVSHLDTDHSGNLVEALARCPNAVMVTSQGEAYRAGASLGVPAARMRALGPGEDLDAGDRTLQLWWATATGKPQSLGLIRADGVTVLRPGALTGGLQGSALDHMAVSVEPPGGSPTGQPTGPVVFYGKLVP